MDNIINQEKELDFNKMYFGTEGRLYDENGKEITDMDIISLKTGLLD